MPTAPLLAKKKLISHGLLLLVWIAIATVLRLAFLEAKPPWADEWATLVFSLGHSFRTVPLDRIISVDELLQPLQIERTAQLGDVVRHLMSESNHPPFYFLLSHLWLQLFSSTSGLVSLWGARSLSALLGVAAVPALFAWGGWVWRSPLVGHLAAALMAVSPYGIYLAQEARHYTLAIVWIIASLSCFVWVTQQLQRRVPPAGWLILAWVVVNGLGMATHYFFILTLAAQALVLLAFWISDIKKNSFLKVLVASCWRRVYAAIAGTLLGGLVWLSAWRSIPDSRLTTWIHAGNLLGGEFLEPIGRLLAWLVTMLFLLPIEGTPLSIAIASGILLLGFMLWLVPVLVRSCRLQMERFSTGLMLRALLGFVSGTILLILLVTYLLGTDLTLAARYQFVYFPAVIMLVSVGLAGVWQEKMAGDRSLFPTGKNAVIVTLLAGLLGSLTVIGNLGYQKADRPDLVIPVMLEVQQADSETPPILMTTVHKTHEQTGEMMGLAWELEQLARAGQLKELGQFRFLLAHKQPDRPETATQSLHKVLSSFPRPLQLWVVNFSASTELEQHNCQEDSDNKYQVPGYRFRLYRCAAN